MAPRSRQEKWSCPVSVPLLVDINERVLQEDLDHLREILHHSPQQWIYSIKYSSLVHVYFDVAEEQTDSFQMVLP